MMNRFLCGLLMLAVASTAAAENPAAGDPVAGRRLYFEGLSAIGEPIAARTEGDIKISGAQFSCVSCHRPSAYGSSEGGIYVPPIRGGFLFQPNKGDRLRIFKELYQEIQSKEFWAEMRDPRLRPAYTNATLSKAVTEGVDAAGREMKRTMPRYDLSATDMANLTAYLKTLDAKPDPGVMPTTINFATIVTPDADPDATKAMLDTMSAFFKWMNLHTQGNLQSPGFSPNYRSDFLATYRYWDLQVWELKGEPETWRGQLLEFYKSKPVFAVISGMVNGPHSPIADFCDSTSTPCVMPITELPQTNDALYKYSLYFNRGRELEGEAAGSYLTTTFAKADILQYYLEDDLGAVSAVALLRTINRSGARIVSEGFPTPEKLKEAVAKCCSDKIDALVIWPGTAVGQIVPSLDLNKLKNAAEIILPSDAISSAAAFEPKSNKRLRFVYPYEKPGVLHPREFDVRAWMGSRRLRITNERVQFQTYYALTLIEHSLEHLLGDFNREYLIELIEHEAEKNLNIGTYPTLALGPGQRFASKGAYVMRLDEKAEDGMVPASAWIVP